jgi:hypothetical protein
MIHPSCDHCRLIIPLLKKRSGQCTTVMLSERRQLEVYQIVPGDSFGDNFENVTTNVSPRVQCAAIDLTFTDEVSKIIAPVTGERLWEDNGPPNVC